MLIDADAFFKEAEAEEQHVMEMERERLNMLQRRVKSTTLLEEMSKITDYANPSETVLLQAFNWESHQAGKGNWRLGSHFKVMLRPSGERPRYGIVSSKLEMFKELGITDLWLPPCSASVAPQGYLPSQLFNLDGSKYGNKVPKRS